MGESCRPKTGSRSQKAGEIFVDKNSSVGRRENIPRTLRDAQVPGEVAAARRKLPQERLYDLLADRILAGRRFRVRKQQGPNLGCEPSVRSESGWNFFGGKNLLRRGEECQKHAQ